MSVWHRKLAIRFLLWESGFVIPAIWPNRVPLVDRVLHPNLAGIVSGILLTIACVPWHTPADEMEPT